MGENSESQYWENKLELDGISGTSQKASIVETSKASSGWISIPAQPQNISHTFFKDRNICWSKTSPETVKESNQCLDTFETHAM